MAMAALLTLPTIGVEHVSWLEIPPEEPKSTTPSLIMGVLLFVWMLFLLLRLAFEQLQQCRCRVAAKEVAKDRKPREFLKEVVPRQNTWKGSARDQVARSKANANGGTEELVQELIEELVEELVDTSAVVAILAADASASQEPPMQASDSPSQQQPKPCLTAEINPATENANKSPSPIIIGITTPLHAAFSGNDLLRVPGEMGSFAL
jgi:hypothetical protein